MFIFIKASLKCYKNLVTSKVMPNGQPISISFSIHTVEEKLDIFKELGFSEMEGKALLRNKYISKLQSAEIKKNIDRLQNLGLYNKYLLIKQPDYLKYSSFAIDHRYKCLEESGVSAGNITLHNIMRVANVFRKSVSILKEAGVIDSNVNVTQNILSYSDIPADQYYANATNLEYEDLVHIQMKAVRYYVQWLFGFTNQEIDTKFKIYWLKYKSIRLVKQNFDILRNHFNFPKEKISRHLYLLQGHPDNLLKLLERVPQVVDQSLQHIANLAPKILIRSPDTLIEILKIFEDKNIDLKTVSKFPEIFTLAPDTVRERLNIILSDPSYKYLVNNKRLFKNISNFRSLTHRTRIIQRTNWRCYSADILCTGSKIFEERSRLHPDYYTGVDICHFLHKELELPRKEISRIMSQHVLWHFVPLSTISATLTHLREAGFSHKHIIEALPVILYPTTEVENCIEQLKDNPDVDCCRDSSSKLRPELVLQLVLYYLEQPFHFTGNGVWELDPSYADP